MTDLNWQEEEQRRLENLPESERVWFNGRYWYSRGPFHGDMYGTAQKTREDALKVFAELLETRRKNLERQR